VGSCDLSLRELTSGPCEKEDIVEELDGRRERELITAASAAYLNNALQLTAYSLCSCVAVRRESGVEECGNTLGYTGTP